VPQGGRAQAGPVARAGARQRRRLHGVGPGRQLRARVPAGRGRAQALTGRLGEKNDLSDNSGEEDHPCTA
jgi:hypothetical protein